MKKILWFLMVGLAFTALQVGAAEVDGDCSDFAPGTPPRASCEAVAKEAAGGPSAGSLETPGMAPATGSAQMGDPNMAPPTGVTGGPPMGDPAATPSMGIGQRIKNLFGIGAKDAAPPTGAPGTAPMGDPSCAPLANGTLPPHCK